MANEFITRKGFISLDDSTVSGSLFVSGTIEATQTAVLEGLENAAADTDKFLVATTDGTVKFRTGAEVLSDIGAAGGATAAGKEGEISWFNSDTSISGSGWMRVVTGSTYGIDLDGYYYSSKTDGSQGAKFIAIENETSASVTKQNLMNFGIDSGAFTWIGYSGSYGGGSTEVGRFIIDKGFTNHYRLGTANFQRAAATNTFYVWPETTFFNGVNMEGHLTITGSLTVSGSNTFRNIGPAYFTEGNVGIGTESPTSDLTVQGSGSTIFDVQGSQGQLFSVTDSLVGSLFSVNDISGLPILEVFDTDKMVAGTFGQNTLVVTGSRVGIGTDTPDESLVVQSSTSPVIKIANGGGTSPFPKLTFHRQAGVSSDIYYDTANKNLILQNNYSNVDSSGNIYFNTRGTGTKAVITGAGDVGIGTTSPRAKLEIKNGTTGQSYSNQSGLLIDVNGTSNSYSSLHVGSSVGSNNLVVTNAGNVGIGVSPSSTAKLHVVGSSTSTDNALRVANNSNTPLMLVRNDGFVSINNSKFDYTLDVQKLTNENDDTIINIRSNWANTSTDKKIGSLFFTAYDVDVDSGATKTAGGIRVFAENEWTSSANSNAYMNFNTLSEGAFGERMRITSAGNVGIGTTTPSDKLDVHGIIAVNSVAFISQSANVGYIGDIDQSDEITNLDIQTAGASTRIFLDDSGNVGINTDTPSYALDLVLNASSDRLNITRGGAQKAYITGDGAGVFYANLVSYGNSLSGGGGMFQYGGGYGTQAVAHRFKHITGTFTGTSGNQTMVEILSSVSQSATAGYTGLKVDVSETSIGSGTNNLLDLQVDSTSKYSVNRDGDVTMAGDLTVEGIVTAQEFHTEFVSASIIYQSGSTKFGDTVDDTHSFTGSIGILGDTDHTFLDFDGTSYGEMQYKVKGIRTFGFETYNSSNINTVFSNSGPGAHRVGINTTSPQVLLHVGPSALTANYDESYTTLAVSDVGNGAQLILRGLSPKLLFDSSGGGNGEIYLDRSHLNFLSGTPDTPENSRLFISSSGDIGIGTTSPASHLHLKSSVGNTVLTIEADSDNNNEDDNPQIHFLTDGGFRTGAISVGNATYESSLNENAFNIQGYKLRFHTATTQDYDLAVERMRIDQNGKVGIGTTSPTYKLDVETSDDIVASFVSTDNKASIRINDNDTSVYVSAENAKASFGFNVGVNAGNLNVDQSGNVGIGTASPNHKLDIYADTNMPLRIHRPSSSLDTTEPVGIGFSHRGDNNTSTTDTRAGIFSSYNGDLFLSVDAGGRVDDDPFADAALFIEGTNKNVGIGDTNPTMRLKVVDSTAGLLSAFTNSSSNGLGMQITAGNGTNPILQLRNYAGGEQFRVQGNGNVGIGTTTPAGKLHVYGGRTYLAPQGDSDSGVNSDVLVAYNPHDSAFTADALAAYNAHTSWDIGSRSTYTISSRTKNGSVYTYAGEHATANTAIQRFVQFNSNNTSPLLNWTFFQYDGAGTTALDLKRPQKLWSIQTYENAGVDTKLILSGSGQLRLNKYGSGNFQADSVYRLAVDANGNIIEESLGDGSINGLGASRYIARWADTDSLTTSSMYEDASGNIGIGTITPAQALQVEGNADINGVLYMDYGSIIDDGRFRFGNGNDFSLGFHSSTSTLRLAAGNTLTSNVRLTVDSSGKVGIGTTSPSFKLDVAGSLRTTQTFYLNGQASGYSTGFNGATLYGAASTFAGEADMYGTLVLQSRSDGAARPILFVNGATPSEKMRVAESGNVGIGTTTPDYKLQVEGGADVVNIAGSGSTANTSIFSVDGNNGRLFEVSDDLSDSLFSVNTIAGLPVLEVFADNRIVAGAYNQNDLVISGSRVGIGTATPGAKLEVVGADQVAFFESTTSGLYNKYTINSSSTIGYIGAGGSIFTGALSNDFGVRAENSLYFGAGGNSISMVIDTADNVGIGATDPLRRLHVAGGNGLAINADTTQYYGVYIPANGEGADPEIQIGDWHNASARLQWDSSARAFNIDTQYSTGAGTFNITGNDFASTFLTVLPTGNVGINTTSPSSKLHIYDTTQNNATYSASLYVQNYGAVDQNGRNQIGGLFHSKAFGSANVYTYGVVGIADKNGSFATRMVGVQGIGKISGTNQYGGVISLVGVEGKVETKESNTAYRNNRTYGLYSTLEAASGSTVETHYGVYVHAGTIDADATVTSSYAIVTELNAGNVGIGTTSPNYTLDVNGDVGINEYIYHNGDSNTYFGFDTVDSYRAVMGGTERLRINTTGVVVNEGGSSATEFRVEGDTDTNLIRTDAANNRVGIGTGSPDVKLHILNSSEETIRLEGSNNTTAIHFWSGSNRTGIIGHSNGSSIATLADAGDMVLRSEAGKKVHFATNGANVRMTVDAGGRIGMNNTAPSYRLDIKNTSSEDANMAIRNTSTGDAGIWFDGSNGDLVGGDYAWIGQKNSKIFEIRSSVNAGNIYLNPRDGAGAVDINGDLTVSGIVTAQEFHTEFVSASIIYQSGSTQFGDTADDTHEFTGTLTVNGGSELNVARFVSNTNDSAIVIGENGTQTGEQYLAFQNSNTGTNAWMTGFDDDEHYAIAYGAIGEITGANTYLRVLQNGNVGIGVQTPGAKLEIKTDNTSQIPIKVTHNNYNDWLIQKRRSDDTQKLGIKEVNSNGGMGFATADTVRMAIDASGNVGIGTTSPGSLFEIYKDSTSGQFATYRNNAGFFLHRTYADYNNAGTISEFQTRVGVDGTYGSIGMFSDHSFQIRTNNTSRIAIQNTGEVGIGTTSPSYKLEVNGKIATPAGAIVIEGQEIYANSEYSGNDGSVRINRFGYLGGQTRFRDTVIYDGKGNQILTVDGSTSNIGIRTTAPISPLDVIANSGGNSIALRMRPTSNDYSFIQGRSNDGTEVIGEIAFNRTAATTGNMLFYTGNGTNSVERMRITSAGNVGIGLTNPTTRTEILSSLSLRSAANAAHRLRLEARSDYYNDIQGGGIWISDGSASGPFSGQGAHMIIEGRKDSRNLYFKIGNVTSPQHVMDYGGNVGIGTTAPAQKLHVNGASIIADSNTVIDPDASDYSVVAGAINDGGGWGVNSGIGGRAAGAGDTWAIGHNGGALYFGIGNGSSANSLSTFLRADPDRSVTLEAYGSGNVTGTPAYNLQVDSSGNIIETAAAATSAVGGSGVAEEVAVWSSSSNVSGSQAFTWNGDVLFIDGVMEAREKSFNIKHPTKENKRLIYGVLEGPEHGVYCRGKVEGNVIELPEEWTGLVEEDSITVQLTSIGSHQNLYVVDIKDNKVFIKNGNTFSSKIKAFYYIQGMRKDVKPLVTERDA